MAPAKLNTSAIIAKMLATLICPRLIGKVKLMLTATPIMPPTSVAKGRTLATLIGIPLESTFTNADTKTHIVANPDRMQAIVIKARAVVICAFLSDGSIELGQLIHSDITSFEKQICHNPNVIVIDFIFSGISELRPGICCAMSAIVLESRCILLLKT